MAPSRPSPRVIAGRYLLYEEIASGGMATVYLGRQLGAVGFARAVAIKQLHPHLARERQFTDMFIDEARLAARIRHPNVMPTVDVVQEDGELFLVMDYVAGETLGVLMLEAHVAAEPIPLGVAIGVVHGMLLGLHAAHEATSEAGDPLDIVHRDVSPSNVLVGVDGVVRVLDFGIAKASGRITSTRPGELKGKLRYMAPEQVTDRDVSRRSDVYAAAVVLWELLAGRPLFTGTNDAVVMSRVLEGAVRAPSEHAAGIPRSLDDVVMTGLVRDPALRFSSAQAMALALEQAFPPAPARTLGDWVSRLARTQLAEREARLSALERNITPAGAPPAPRRDEVTETATKPAPPKLVLPGAMPAPPPVTPLPMPAAPLATPLAMVPSRDPPRAAPAARPLAWMATSSLLAGGVVLAAALVWRSFAAPVVPAVPAETTEPPRAATPIRESPPSATVAPPAAPGDDEEPVFRPAAGVAASARPIAPPVTSAPRAAASGTNCNPPYMLDAQGRRKVKRECL